MGLEEKLQANLAAVRARIEEACTRTHRDPDSVYLVVVTKSVGMDVILALVKMGVTDLGENRVQQLTERAAAVSEFLQRRQEPESSGEPPRAPRWHMVGNLQRKKVSVLLPSVAMIHSVDRLRLAEEINKRADGHSRRVDVLLEVNCADEPQKGGAAVCAAAHLGEQIASLPNLRVRGLMTMAPLTPDETIVRNAFSRVAELFEEMRSEYAVGDTFDILSMGMSSDFEIAVQCGANLLRIGSALFEGARGADLDDSCAGL
ncbi:MAG: YggS family pyridoxal phosphate-dependent enzyme [Phycisphaerae bacterium]